MIIYSGTKRSFSQDAINGIIAKRIDGLFARFGVRKESLAEFNSWRNSLPMMAALIGDRRISDDVSIALEYQIPLTSKRVDFMIGGKKEDKDNIVIIELKQWSECKVTSMENVVEAFVGGAEREVVHPSQQAYSYAKLIENFNEAVRENNIGLIPCAYLHNYEESKRDQICNPVYQEAIHDAPVFLQQDSEKLQDFIVEYVTAKSDRQLFDIIENGKLKPSKSLQETVGSILDGNREFEMIDEQQVAYATILRLVENSIGNDQKHTIIVEGGPGTGKSVIAINLLAKIINNGYSCAYVTKNGAPRYTFSESLLRGRHSISYLKGLFKGSGSFVDTLPNTYDCLLSDESHRLNLKSGLFSNQGENQVKEIINASKISVFFIDEDQMVTMKDIGTVQEIIRQAHALGSIVHHSESLKLTSQFRCNGSDGYIAFLDDLLQIRETANYNDIAIDYDLELFDNPCEMREALRKKNTDNKARMIAGYCYPWNSRKDKTKMDIELEDGFEAQWNFDTNTFATAKDSFDQVGCIHSTQGLEFDYVGIIIGLDLRYENGEVITDYTERAKNDFSIKGAKNDEAKADRIIRNTYKTLLSRGQKGCYIYCQDKPLQEYIAQRIRNLKH